MYQALFFPPTHEPGNEANTALNLNLTVFYLISQQFGTRGCQEHHQLRVEHLKFVNSPCTGTTEYVEWVEGPTKARQEKSIGESYRGCLLYIRFDVPSRIFGETHLKTTTTSQKIQAHFILAAPSLMSGTPFSQWVSTK